MASRLNVISKHLLSPAATAAAVYNPEWNPTGIEGGVDTKKLPWIAFPDAKGCSYKPLRSSNETSQFTVVIQVKKGTTMPDLVYLSSADFMVLSGKMKFPSGPLSGQVEAGIWGYIPANSKITGVTATEDCEYLMNLWGPLAVLNKNNSVKSLFTGESIKLAAKKLGIQLVPSTLAECMEPRKNEYKGKDEPLAISGKDASTLVTATPTATSDANPHFVDTRKVPWFESMPGISLKVLRVSAETGVVTTIVKHMASAPPHYHLGAGDFMMLAGHLGYRAGPPEGYGAGVWFYEPAGARHESTQNVGSEDCIYLANLYGPIQFDEGVGTPISAVLSWMSYLEIAKAAGMPLVDNVFPQDKTWLASTK